MAKHISVGFNTGPMTRRRRIQNQNEKFHYHFARNDLDRIRDLCEVYGYEIVRQGDAKVPGDKGSLEGAVTAGGDVLLRCPVELWQEREKERAAATKAQLEGPKETFKTEAARYGVKTIDDSKVSVGPMKNVANKND